MPTVRTTPLVKILMITLVSAFLAQLIGDTFLGTHILETFGFVPALFFEKHYIWQAFTYMFMHADLFHILFNILILWMIGSELEGQWGTREFAKYYFVCGISAAFFYSTVQLFLRGTPAEFVPMVGASGAIYGLLVAYGIIYSERTMLFMMVFPMKAKHFVLILAGIELISTVFYSRSGIANAAHLGGMVVGFGYLLLKAYLRVRTKRVAMKKSNRKSSQNQHLRLVVNNDLFKEFDADDDDSRNDKPTIH